MKLSKLLVTISIALLLGGCNTTRGSGVNKTETRAVGEFDEIAAATGLHVEVSVGATGPIEISGDDNLVPLVTTKVEGHKLFVAFEKATNVEASIPVVVKVKTASLKALEASAGAHLDATGIKADALSIETSSGAFVKADGTATSVDARSSSGSDLDASHVVASTATVRASSGSKVKLQATSSVTGDASSGAHVHVDGSPATKSVKTSSGADVD